MLRARSPLDEMDEDFETDDLWQYYKAEKDKKPAVQPDARAKNSIKSELQKLSCSQIHALGAYYFKQNRAAVEDFLEFPKKKAIRFLTQEIFRVKDIRVDIPIQQHFRSIIDIMKSQHSRVTCPANSKNEIYPNVCPRGYEMRKQNTRSGEKPVEGCCTQINSTADKVPISWNAKIEAQVLESIRIALLEFLMEDLHRKMFEVQNEDFSYLPCDDAEILGAPLTRALALGERVATSKAAASTLAALAKAGRKVNAAGQKLLSYRGIQDVKNKSKEIVKWTRKYVGQISKQFVEAPTAAILLRSIKGRILRATVGYILKNNILDHFLEADKRFRVSKDLLLVQQKNYKHAFASRLIAASKLAAFSCERSFRGCNEPREQLWNIFNDEMEQDKDFFHEMFSDSVHSASEEIAESILEGVTLGASKVIGKVIERFTKKSIKDAFSNTFVAFFFMDTLSIGMENILEYILTVFDISAELCENARAVQKYPFLLTWNTKIQSQIIGSNFKASEARLSKQKITQSILQHTNQCISDMVKNPDKSEMKNCLALGRRLATEEVEHERTRKADERTRKAEERAALLM